MRKNKNYLLCTLLNLNVCKHKKFLFDKDRY